MNEQEPIEESNRPAPPTPDQPLPPEPVESDVDEKIAALEKDIKKTIGEVDRLVSTAVDTPEPLKRKCEIKQVLPTGVIQLLASAPHNETVRHVLLAHLRVPVPEELKTYKDIQDWIEFNIEPPSVPIAKMPTAPGRESDLVQVLIVATETEHGSCSYSADYRGSGTIGISREDILTAAVENDDVDDFWNDIRQIMYGGDVRDHVDMEKVEDTERTSDHNCNDSDGITVEIRTAGYEAVKQALHTLDPDRYDELFG